MPGEPTGSAAGSFFHESDRLRLSCLKNHKNGLLVFHCYGCLQQYESDHPLGILKETTQVRWHDHPHYFLAEYGAMGWANAVYS